MAACARALLAEGGRADDATARETVDAALSAVRAGAFPTWPLFSVPKRTHPLSGSCAMAGEHHVADALRARSGAASPPRDRTLEELSPLSRVSFQLSVHEGGVRWLLGYPVLYAFDGARLSVRD